MPLSRSPPPQTPVAPALSISGPGPIGADDGADKYVAQPHDSDTPSERSGNSNVSVRRKRRRELDDDHDQLKAEMTRLFTTLSASVTQNFKDLKKQNDELKDSLQMMSDKYDSVLKSLKSLEEERERDKKLILKLEEKNEVLERKTKSASLELRNVPALLNHSTGVETKEDIGDIVKLLAKAADVELQDSDIRDVYRIKTNKDNIKPIMIELNSTLKKEKILQGIKNLNKRKAKEDKLSTGNLKLPGPPRPVYVSEALTFKAQRIFYLARQFAQDNGYSYCWTSRGFVYIRRVEGEAPTRIDKESDIGKLLKRK